VGEIRQQASLNFCSSTGCRKRGGVGILDLQIFKAIQKQKKIILLHGLSSERADISITVGANPRTMEHWLLSPKGVEQERYGK